ncbi:MAG: 16S rRNA (guanine(527)-N(7))-methyltransferase RsmG [Oscillospiraceae bacterium]|jgi:16S rRNA (guanine527-N7)-methyltransferase|nr:16S rRNA (guanine(527)-N(7))-methyltransferase RsmG [Oscillospiraceae bacterium]
MIAQAILDGCAAMGVSLPPGAPERFARFDSMLRLENAKQNLTRDIDAPDAVARLYLDSLAPLSFPDLIPQCARVVDIGSGAGFPGIPIAIARGDAHVALVDALGKRVAFLAAAVAELYLNAQAIHSRAEAFANERRGQFDVALIRAVAPLNVLLEYASPLLKPGGMLIAYKGPGVAEELDAAARAAEILKAEWLPIRPVEIPGTNWGHVLACAIQKHPCPSQYPRRDGVPERKPLGYGGAHTINHRAGNYII